MEEIYRASFQLSGTDTNLPGGVIQGEREGYDDLALLKEKVKEDIEDLVKGCKLPDCEIFAEAQFEKKFTGEGDPVWLYADNDAAVLKVSEGIVKEWEMV